MSDYDFDVPIPPGTTVKGGGRAGEMQRMPAGASRFFASAHKTNTVAATAARVRKEHKLPLVCRRVTENGVEGFRVWHLKDEEK